MRFTKILAITVGVLCVSCRPSLHATDSQTEASATIHKKDNFYFLRSASLLGGLSSHKQTTVYKVLHGQLRLNKPGVSPKLVYLTHSLMDGKNVYHIFDDNGVYRAVFGSDQLLKQNAAVINFKIEGVEFNFWGTDYYLPTVQKLAKRVENHATKLKTLMNSFSRQDEMIPTNILNFYGNKKTNEQLKAHASDIEKRYNDIALEANQILRLDNPMEASKRLKKASEQLRIVYDDDREFLSLIKDHAIEESQNATEAALKTFAWSAVSIAAVPGLNALVGTMTAAGTAAAGASSAFYTAFSNLSASLAGGFMTGFGGGTLALAEGGVAGSGGATLAASTMVVIAEDVTLTLGLAFAMSVPIITGGASSFYGNAPKNSSSVGKSPKFVKEAIEGVEEFVEESIRAPAAAAGPRMSDGLQQMIRMFDQKLRTGG